MFFLFWVRLIPLLWGVALLRPIVRLTSVFLLLQRVQAALPPPPTQQHLVTTEQAVLTVTMTPPRVDTNPPVHDNTPIRWQQGHTNHHNTTEQQTNRHGMGQAPKRTHRDYIFGKVIGEGSFSTVYLAKDIHNGKECASKSTVLFLLLTQLVFGRVHSYARIKRNAHC